MKTQKNSQKSEKVLKMMKTQREHYENENVMYEITNGA